MKPVPCVRAQSTGCALAVLALLAVGASPAPTFAAPPVREEGVRTEHPLSIGVEALGRGALYSVQLEANITNAVGVGVDFEAIEVGGFFGAHLSFYPVGDSSSLYLSPTVGCFIFDFAPMPLLCGAAATVGYEYRSHSGIYVRPTVTAFFPVDDFRFYLGGILPGLAVGFGI